MKKGKEGECSAPVRAAAWRNTKNTLQKFNYTCVLVSFSGALDKTNNQTYKQKCISLAFEAIAPSSGGIQTLIDINISQDGKITTTKK